MTYDPTIPAINTRIDATFNLITTNFDQANTIFGEDHYPFNFATPADRGKHKQVTLFNLPNGATPVPTPPVGENAIYSAEITEGDPAVDRSVLFSVRDGSATPYPIQAIRCFGAFTVSAAGAFAELTNGFGATAARISAGIYRVTFTDNFAAADLNYTVLISYTGVVGSSPPQVMYFNKTNSSFDIRSIGLTNGNAAEANFRGGSYLVLRNFT